MCRKNLRLVEDISCSYTPRTPLSYIFDHKVSSSPDDALPEENRLPSPVLFLHMGKTCRKNFKMPIRWNLPEMAGNCTVTVLIDILNHSCNNERDEGIYSLLIIFWR